MGLLKKKKPLPDNLRQIFFNLLKEEGFNTEQIENQIERLQFLKRKIENPKGLNQIFEDVSGISICDDDWDKNIPKKIDMGKQSDEAAKGMQSQIWGIMMQKQACQYLEKKLKVHGWTIKEGQEIDEKSMIALVGKEKIQLLSIPI